MRLNLSLEQLLDEHKFLNIKRNFLLKDYGINPNDDNPALNIEQDEIITFIEKVTVHKGFDELGLENEWYESKFEEVTVNFYQDYLLPAIGRLLKRYKDAFIKYMQENHIYETTAIQNFSGLKIKSLKNLKVKVSKCSHLNQAVKERTGIVIDDLQEFIASDFYQKTLSVAKKIPFKLTKIQVVLLFQLLYKNKLIGGHTDDLSRLIDQYFQYYDKSQDKFQDFVGTQTLVRKIMTGERSSEKALTELENIFKSEDFYNSL